VPLFEIYAQPDPAGLQEFLSGAVIRLRRLLCGLQGHRAMLHFAPRLLNLRCARCGHETPGWQIGSGKVQ
jgi:hypothetical protein